MSSRSPELEDHKAWLGYLQPEGLVVTAQTLADAGLLIDRAQLAPLQQRFFTHTELLAVPGATDEALGIAEFHTFLQDFLGWLPTHLVGTPGGEPIPESLIVALPDFEEVLSPTLALRKFDSPTSDQPWSLLVQQLPIAQDLDRPHAAHTRGWDASPTRKFERLLRDTHVPVGLISNGVAIRLVYAPAKENSGHITFPVQAMTEVGGRLILGAFHLLLRSQTVLNAPDRRHLHRLLAQSREYQATVSVQLAEQVLTALYELLRGFQSAHDRTHGQLLRHPLQHAPNQIYEGLLTVLLRLVFLLFAEDRGLMPGGRVYTTHYGIHALFEKLRADHEKYAERMDDRFGAWPRLLALFRIVYQGCRHGELRLPARHGHLFDPERFPFLEGRQPREEDKPENLPMVSDGVLHRVLTNLLILGGERISYRTLDVEEIGSVYQTIMGFGILISPGTTIALRGKRKNGGVPAAPIVVLEDLLGQAAKDRSKWLKEQTDHEFSGDADKQLKAASTVDDVLAVLGPKIDRNVTPAPVPKGKLALQPTDERRRSGSHYTPRSFTGPIVRKTLEPILKRLGVSPQPDEILSLKIADIAVGSAAFLVEVGRQLADALVTAWHHHGGRPNLPPDETEELLAMRLIAQRCLYGVDRNPMAVDLAKLSLWLATLARDHPFTFLDHSIRCGDSLVGLTRRQIETFTWKTDLRQGQLWEPEVRKRVTAALRERQNLMNLGDDYGSPLLKREKLEKADELLDLVRFIGDCAIAAFFSADKDKAREAKREELAQRLAAYLGKGDLRQRPTAEVDTLRDRPPFSPSQVPLPSSPAPLAAHPSPLASGLPSSPPVLPFHWEIEFPEVFDRENPGFDGIVGNPPFAGHVTVTVGNRLFYTDWVREKFPESGGKSDLVAFFFRQAFAQMRRRGTLGLVATNTIAQGDTRSSGLRWICLNEGWIFNATRRVRWPGQAAVVVSVINICKSEVVHPCILNGHEVPIITAYLFHDGGSDDPAKLRHGGIYTYQGSVIRGKGFLFEDGVGEATPLSEMHRLAELRPSNSEVVRRFVGGEDLNDSPTLSSERYAIDFGEMELSEAERWPELLAIVRDKVLSFRSESRARTSTGRVLERWWEFGHTAKEMYHAIRPLPRAIAIAQTSNTLAFACVDTQCVLAQTLVVFSSDSFAVFSLLQSRAHQLWALFFAATMKDDARYIPTDCFETFPFPADFETNPALEAAGREYYEFRAALMQDLWLGLTEIYNLFHSPDGEALARLEALYRKRAAKPDWRTAEAVPIDHSPLTLYATPAAALAAIQRLRTLHVAMDTVVLTAYGWTDLIPQCNCEFLLDYGDDESDSSAEESSGRKKKKPWRYRWPDDLRDEVLARLLKLNGERAEQERLTGGVQVLPPELSEDSSASDEPPSDPPDSPPKPPHRPKKPGPQTPGPNSSARPLQRDLIPPPQGDLFA
jgi:class 3 adenylate cyclase